MIGKTISHYRIIDKLGEGGEAASRITMLISRFHLDLPVDNGCHLGTV